MPSHHVRWGVLTLRACARVVFAQSSAAATCSLGYETISADDTTCVQPDFKPARGWEGSSDKARLVLQDKLGRAVTQSSDAQAPALLTKHTYTIPAPLLQPKERKFAGYEQPYSRIHYELDFALGAEVDLGCGTAVVGDASSDINIPKTVDKHPMSMHEFSYQFPSGRATTTDPGYYPARCV